MKPRRAAAGSGLRQVRIIAGAWKRTPLPVATAEGLRPTPDRVRETLFNWLHFLFDGLWETRQCLDLFAGSGALGFEAASRGAQQVLMVENAVPALRNLQEVKDKLGATQVLIQKADAPLWMRRSPAAQFDLVFLDPPYSLDLLPELLPACARLLKPGGLVYAESGQDLSKSGEAWMDGWEVVRSDRAGAVHFCLLQCKTVA
ncbi:MAG: rsmD [Paucimonas sp.]|nr:rsmD [Paucimonas sp.]